MKAVYAITPSDELVPATWMIPGYDYPLVDASSPLATSLRLIRPLETT